MVRHRPAVENVSAKDNGIRFEIAGELEGDIEGLQIVKGQLMPRAPLIAVMQITEENELFRIHYGPLGMQLRPQGQQ